MNANELADYLQNKAEVELNPRLQEAATMLRQLQAENEALKTKKLNDLYVDGEIAGWLGYQEGHLVSFLQTQEHVNSFLTATNPVGQVRPVYTSPKISQLQAENEVLKSRELTDEEIIEIYNEILIHDKKSSIKFAKAILRKAQEK